MNNKIFKGMAGAVILAFTAMSAQAAPVDAESAKAIATRHFAAAGNAGGSRIAPSAASMKVVYTEGASSGPCYYVLSPADNGGFVIVSGDDRLPEVLGYCDEGNFDATAIPENVKWWLDSYKSQIDAFYSSPGLQQAQKTPSYRVSMKPVTPLVSTRWNQSTPYNDLCPMDGTTRSVTGCVATAMAQVMKYHNWPVKGTGSFNGVTFEGTTYQWDSMLDDYVKGKYNASEAQAVAVLMRHCGAGVSMQYSSYASGAYSADVQTALINYFGYNKAMKLEFRDGYSYAEWNELVYNELINNRPVYYSGQAPEGGHAFVCDGYRSNGFFHFNWGWGGAYDGYFLLSALNPAGGGIGSYEGGYNTNQMIITGVEPQKDGSEQQVSVVCTGGFTYEGNGFKVVDGPVYGGSYQQNEFYNPHNYTIEIQAGVKITNVSNSEDVRYVADRVGMRAYQQWEGFEGIQASIPAGLPDGRYRVTPAILPKDRDWVDVRPVNSKQTYVDLVVANGVNTLTNPPADDKYSKLILAGITYAPQMKGSGPIVAQFDIANVGNNDYFGAVSVKLEDLEDPSYNSEISLMTSIPMQSVSSVTFNKELAYYGDMRFTLYDGENNELGHYDVNLARPSREEMSDRFNQTTFEIGAIAPNFASTDLEYEVGFQIYNNSMESASTGLKIQLFDYSTGEVCMERTASSEIELGRMEKAAVAFTPANWEVGPGYYYWMLRAGDGGYLSGPWPLVLTSGAVNKNGADYYLYDSAAKRAYIGASENLPKRLEVESEVEGYTVDRIGAGALTFAYGVEEMIFPASVASYGPAAFYCAEGLKTLQVNAVAPPAIDAQVLPEERFGQISLVVPDAAANMYMRTPVWKQFFMPAWTSFEYADGITYESGLQMDGDTPFSPYYISAGHSLTLKLKSPDSKPFVAEYTVDGGELQYVWNGGDGEITLPAIAGKRAAVRFTTAIPAGVDFLTSPNPSQVTVYNMFGVCVLRNASAEKVSELPAGLYIVNGRKTLIK